MNTSSCQQKTKAKARMPSFSSYIPPLKQLCFSISILSFGCTIPTSRESLELISFLDNGQIFEARFTKGDTGLYKGQAHLRVHRWMREGTPMSYHLDIPPPVSEIDAQGADFWGQRLYVHHDTWQIHIRSEEYNVSGQFPKAEKKLEFHTENWNVDVLQPNGLLLGWSSAMGRSGMLKGNSILFHRYGEGLLQDERHNILAFGTDQNVGIEYNEYIQQSWGTIQDQRLNHAHITLSMHAHHIEGMIAERSFRFTPSTIIGEEDLYDHLTTAERTLAHTMLSTSKRYITSGTLTINNITLPAIHIYYGTNPLTPSKK